MREIKFEFLYKGLPFSSKNNECNWFKKVYTIDQLCESPLSKLCDVHNQATLIAKRQFTGMHDKYGVEIYKGDIVIVDDDYEKCGCSAGEKYEVIFNHGGFRLKPKYTNGKGFYIEDSEPYTVIGNIHQHAHLLEQNK